MINAKEAVGFAKQHAAAMLGQATARLEEIERDEYKGRDVWRITLGFPPDTTSYRPAFGRSDLGLWNTRCS